MKGQDDCVPELGEVWLYKGRHSSMSSVTLFFSPQIGDVPGDLIGIEVNYYGEILERLLGVIFQRRNWTKIQTHTLLLQLVFATRRNKICVMIDVLFQKELGNTLQLLPKWQTY